MKSGCIFDIQRFSVHDGPGIRTTVFMKGCPLRCGWCHNPEGLSRAAQIQFFEEKCIGCLRCEGKRDAAAASRCPTGALTVCGKEITSEQLLREVLRDRDFYSPVGGVTFSGGECLLQADFVSECLALIKQHSIHTAIDTAGAVPWESLEKTLPFCDLYLYDVKCADSELHLRHTGMKNDQILANLTRLSNQGKPIWIRIPVIPDVNDNDGEMQAIASIVAACPSVERVTLMPYHTLGMNKYELLGMTVPYRTDKAIEAEQLAHWKDVFRRINVTVD